MRLPDVVYARGEITVKKPEKSSMEQWAPTVKGLVDAYVNMQKAEEELKINEAAIGIMTASEEVEATLLNQGAVNIDQNIYSPTANEAIRNRVPEEEIVTVNNQRFVPAELVMREAYDLTVNDVFNSYTSGMSNDSKAAVKRKIANQQIRAAGNLSKRQVTLKLEKMNAGFKNAYDSYLQAGDWTNAEQLAEQAVASGAWSSEEYLKNREQGKKDLYQGTFMSMIQTAKDMDELNEVRSNIANNAMQLGAENVRTLMSDINNRESSMNGQRQQVYDATQRAITLKYVQGTLSTDDLVNGLQNEIIDPSFAISMKKSMKDDTASKAGKSDPQVIMNYMRDISALGLTNGGATSVAANAANLRRKWARDATGIDPVTGQTGFPVTLVGKDAIATLEEIDKMEGTVNRPQSFDDAVTLIKNSSAVNGVFNMSNKYQRDAFNDFYSGMLAHVDREGIKANPLQWVQENAKIYSTDIYQSEGASRFVKQFPQYSKYMTKKEVEKGNTKKMVNDLNINAVKADMNKQWRESKITKEELEQQYYLLTGDDGSADKNIENQQLFNETVNEVNNGGLSW